MNTPVTGNRTYTIQEFPTRIYEQVLAYKGKPDEKKYGSMAYTLPILIRTAGLAQALAFVQSKKKEACTNLLNHLAEVVMNDKDGEKFLEKSRTPNMQEYMYLTRRTMQALKWYKRFAESVLDVKPTDVNAGE